MGYAQLQAMEELLAAADMPAQAELETLRTQLRQATSTISMQLLQLQSQRDTISALVTPTEIDPEAAWELRAKQAELRDRESKVKTIEAALEAQSAAMQRQAAAHNVSAGLVFM